MQAEDKELFKSFIRSLPRKDNYYLLIDVQNDQAIDRWMEKIQSGQTIGVVATNGSDMIGYSNLKTNDLAWTAHVGEICISVSAAYRGRGIGKALAEQIFLKARARGLQKIWTRMAISQDAAQHMFMKLGFRTEAVLSDFVKNENGLTEDLVIMSHDFGEHWSF
jgi:ribosomal protein S18 acetylase RimI-like enzyme